MSLKEDLKQAIKNAYPNMYSIERVEALARLRGRRISNGERRLRELARKGIVKPVKHQEGYIIGYLYIPGSEVEVPVVGQIKDERIEWSQEQLFNTNRFYQR